MSKERSATNETFVTQGPLMNKRPERLQESEVKENQARAVSSAHNRTTAVINSQQFWFLLNAVQDQGSQYSSTEGKGIRSGKLVALKEGESVLFKGVVTGW